MGDRGNIALKFSEGGKIYLYTHWHGSSLREILKSALIRGKDRWDDEQYLARIIFSEMIKNDVLGTTGYGISTTLDDGEDKVVTVNLCVQKIEGLTFEEFMGGKNEKIS